MEDIEGVSSTKSAGLKRLISKSGSGLKKKLQGSLSAPPAATALLNNEYKNEKIEQNESQIESTTIESEEHDIIIDDFDANSNVDETLEAEQFFVEWKEKQIGPAQRQNNLIVEGTCNHLFWMSKIAKKSSLEAEKTTKQIAAENNCSRQTDDNIFKTFIIGDKAVGKTSIFLNFDPAASISNFVSSSGMDFKLKTIFIQQENTKPASKHHHQIWDTAYTELVISTYYKDAKGFILVYDITNENSFHNIPSWFQQIKTFCMKKAQFVLVGNKSDLDKNNDRKISYQDGKKLADSLGMEFFETSTTAKHDSTNNVKIVFNKIFNNVLLVHGESK